MIFTDYFQNTNFNDKGQQLPTTKKMMNMQVDYHSNLPKIMENSRHNNFPSTSVYQQQNGYPSSITSERTPANAIGDNSNLRSGSNPNFNNRGFSQFGKSLLDNKAYPINGNPIQNNNNNNTSTYLQGPTYTNQLNNTEPLLNTKNLHSHNMSKNPIGKNHYFGQQQS